MNLTRIKYLLKNEKSINRIQELKRKILIRDEVIRREKECTKLIYSMESCFGIITMPLFIYIFIHNKTNINDGFLMLLYIVLTISFITITNKLVHSGNDFVGLIYKKLNRKLNKYKILDNRLKKEVFINRFYDKEEIEAIIDFFDNLTIKEKEFFFEKSNSKEAIENLYEHIDLSSNEELKKEEKELIEILNFINNEEEKNKILICLDKKVNKILPEKRIKEIFNKNT